MEKKKTIIMVLEVAEEEYEDIIETLQEELDNPTCQECRCVAYETYNEDEQIPDIMKREEN